MPLALDFICPLPNGVHTRPASALAKAARRFVSDVTLTNTRNGQSANSKSVLAVVSAGIRQSDTCRLSISGADEAEAMTTLSQFLAKDFSHSDNPLLTSLTPMENHNDLAVVLEKACAARMSFDPRLILLDVQCSTKADAIKQAVALLHVTGRTTQPHELEQSIWQREAAGSTSFGHGFAIPHCQSDAVLVDSLMMLKLRTPVDWNPTNCQFVRFIILVAIRQANVHTTIFSRLARKLMTAAFRKDIGNKPDPTALCAFLNSSLNI